MSAHDGDNFTGKGLPALIGPVIDLKPAAAAEEAKPADDPAPEPASKTSWLPPQAPLAAGIALAVVLGALGGAATTAALMHENAPPATLAAADAQRALQDSVKQLGSELAMLKAGVATAQRTANTQLDKIAGRLDRAEKAQTEPAGKLAKLQESLDRVEQRQQIAATQTAAPEVTGSIKPKEESKPKEAEGWRLRDFYDGRAIVESRNGTLFRVGPGSNVPGLGKVETIKRENGKVVVVTQSGIIAASLEPRRGPPPYYSRW